MSQAETESKLNPAEYVAVSYYRDYAVNSLATALAARQVNRRTKAVSDAYIERLQTRAFSQLKHANLLLARQQIIPVDEAEFMADALLLHLAHQEEIKTSLG